MGNFDDEYEHQVWENLSERPDSIKYNNIIENLEKLVCEFTTDQYEWLKSCDRTYKFGYENNQFHFFMYCIDWQSIYKDSNGRLTTYDILLSQNTSKLQTKLDVFNKTYQSIKKVFDGKIANSEDLAECRETILNRLSSGLSIIYSTDEHKHKGLNEFFKLIFENLGSVAYEVTDFISPYLKDDSQKSKFVTDLFDRFIPAFEVSKLFNENYRSKLIDMEFDYFFPLHILLRHTVTFKVNFIFKVNEGLNTYKIKNGNNHDISITAHIDEKGSISVKSQDGVFFPPDFSVDEEDFFKFKRTGKQLKFEDIAKSLYDKIKILLPILQSNFNKSNSPNIIYFEQNLYGFEFDKWFYENSGIIKIGSFYPLNSECQLEEGISKKEYELITNRQDIPINHKFKVKDLLIID